MGPPFLRLAVRLSSDCRSGGVGVDSILVMRRGRLGVTMVAVLAAACGSSPHDRVDESVEDPSDAATSEDSAPDSAGGAGQGGSGGAVSAGGAAGAAGECVPDCVQARCGDPNGCGGTCKGTCPANEWCDKEHVCQCGAAPHYVRVDGVCLPSCGELLVLEGLPDHGMGCCGPNGCLAGTVVGAPGETHDCAFCCTGSTPETVCID